MGLESVESVHEQPANQSEYAQKTFVLNLPGFCLRPGGEDEAILDLPLPNHALLFPVCVPSNFRAYSLLLNIRKLRKKGRQHTLSEQAETALLEDGGTSTLSGDEG